MWVNEWKSHNSNSEEKTYQTECSDWLEEHCKKNTQQEEKRPKHRIGRSWKWNKTKRESHKGDSRRVGGRGEVKRYESCLCSRTSGSLLDSDSPPWWLCRTHSEGPSSEIGACDRGRHLTPAASPAARWPWQHLESTTERETERGSEWVWGYVWVLMPRGQRDNMPHSITLTAQRRKKKKRRWSESIGWDNGNRLSQG